MRPKSSREAASVSAASACFSSENTLTSSGCNTCDVCSGRIRRSIICCMQHAIIFAVIWLPWPSIMRRRCCVRSTSCIDGTNTVVSYSNAWLSDVQPLLLVENLQSGGVLVGIQAVLVCFALKMTSGGIAMPVALIHSIAVIHSCQLLTTFQFNCLRILTNTLDD